MKRLTPCLLSAILFFACTRPATEVPVNAALHQKLDAYLSGTVRHLNLAGLTVAITRNDSVIYTGAFGYRSAETKEPLTPRHVFHWASVSKTFVATAVMQLWEQKKIDLDEKLTTYLPYFRQQDAFYKDITIRQMLNHTSGIGDVDDYEWNKPQYDSGALERFVRSTGNDKMLFAPGTDLRYSNTAYEALGDVIAKVSGMSFETYVREHILKPLDMDTTSFLYPQIPDTLRVRGHQWAGAPVVTQHYPYNRMHGPSSTLNANVVEMAHYALAHLHRGAYNGRRILADSIYDRWWTNSVHLNDKPAIGFAWWLNKHSGVKTMSHSGGDTGFRSFFMLVPEKNMSIMLVSNYEVVRTGELANALLDILLNVEPAPARRQIGFAFAEVMKAEGMAAAQAFLTKAGADTVQRALYLWDENDGAFEYPAYLYMEQAMYPQAIELLQVNLTQFPNSGWAQAHLATAYARAGDTALARQHLKKAIALLPEEKSLKEQLDKLK